MNCTDLPLRAIKLGGARQIGLGDQRPVAVLLGWQALTLRPDDGDGALRRFRANRFAGLLMAAACYVVGAAG